MVGPICIIVREAPYGMIHASEALRHIFGALANALKVAVILTEDGVYLAKKDQDTGDSGFTSLSEAVKKAQMIGPQDFLKLYIHKESMISRGIEGKDLQEGFHILGEKEIAEVIIDTRWVLLF